MAEVHHFTYGAFNPIAAYLLAFLGSFLGLLCTGRARDARNRSRRNRWLVIAAFAIGGGGDLADALRRDARLRRAGQPGPVRPRR